MLKKITSILAGGVLLCGLFGCGGAPVEGYKKITAEEAKQLMDTVSVVVVDVRTEAEYKREHIPQAVLLPLDDIDKKAETILPNKKAQILVYCRSGARSASASKKLIQMGYENIMDFGGIISWPYEKEK